jgi:hypothetical protein
MVRLDDVDAKVNESISTWDESIKKRVFYPGHNHDAQIADVNFRITQLNPEAMTDDEYDAALAALRAERDKYREMPAVADDWKWEATGETYASKWTASDFAGRREMLKDMKIRAAKNEHGKVYVIIEAPDEQGSINFRVIGEPPGPSLLERAKAHGITSESHADEFDEI